MQVVFALLVFVSCHIGASFACNGYELKMNAIKNCIPNSMIEVKEMHVNLDNDCNLILTGCAGVKKDVKMAKAHYKLTKNPMPPMEGDVDFCEILEENNIAVLSAFLELFGVSGKCPVKARNVCLKNKKVSIAKYKNQLAIALGTSDVVLNLDHGNGDKSCLNINLTLKRK